MRTYYEITAVDTFGYHDTFTYASEAKARKAFDGIKEGGQYRAIGLTEVREEGPCKFRESLDFHSVMA